MTSASTKRRHKRNAALFAEWVGTPTGQRVTVARENGETLKTITESGPIMVDNRHAMIRVEGIPGNTRLERVRKGWNPEKPESLADCIRREPPSVNGYARRNREIERLRTAMMEAMDECETALRTGSMRKALDTVARSLKTALEKK